MEIYMDGFKSYGETFENALKKVYHAHGGGHFLRSSHFK